jgi:hypothetical protein
MTNSPVDSYIEAVLNAQLRSCGLNDRQQAIVTTDVRRRLNSLLAHWDGLPFRRTALFCGVEEATFLDPHAASLDVRALSVVGIRTSLIEDLGASRPATRELALCHAVLTDDEMPAITRAASEYFDRHAPAQLPPGAIPPHDDVFGALSMRFPAAWHALWPLANMAADATSYKPLDRSPTDLPVGDTAPGGTRATVQSGIDPAYDSALLAYLSQVRETENAVFFSDSFKGVTRNPQKLYEILEFLITNDRAFVTHNYYITANFVARRRRLLRPSHFAYEVEAKLVDQRGLAARHKEALDIVKATVWET